MVVDNGNMKNVIGEVEVKRDSEFFAVPNITRAYGTKYYLDDIELAVLVTVGVNVSAWDTKTTKTSIDLLNEELQLDTENPSRGKSKIKKAILSLYKKGYIRMTYGGDKIKNSTLLMIEVLSTSDELFKKTVVVDGIKFTGYSKVTRRILKLSKIGKSIKFGHRLKVLNHIVWRTYNKGFVYSISFDEWSNVLSVVSSTAKEFIKTLEEDGVIDIVHGDYKKNEDGSIYISEDGRPKQERNTYFLKGDLPEVAEGYRPNAVQKHNRDVAIVKDIEKIVTEGEPRITEHPRLLMSGSKLNDDDIELFLTTESDTLVEIARKRFEAIIGSKKGNGGKDMLLDKEKKVRVLFEGINQLKIKRSIFNLDNPKLSQIEQELTPEQLEYRVSTFGYDNADVPEEYDINTKAEEKRFANDFNDEDDDDDIFNENVTSKDEDDLLEFWRNNKAT